MNKATILVSNRFSCEEKFKIIFKCKYAYFLKSEREYKSVLNTLKQDSEIVTLLKIPKLSFEGLRDKIKKTKREKGKITVLYAEFSPFQIYPFEWIGDFALFPLKGFVSGNNKTRGYVFLSKDKEFPGISSDFPEMPYLETLESRRKMAENTTLHLIREIDGFKSIFKEIYYPYLTDKKNAKSFLKSQGNVFSIKFESIDTAESFKNKLSLFKKENFVFGSNLSSVKRYKNYLIFSIGLESVKDLVEDIRHAKASLK
ncbi:hypothetical protein TTHT_1792 [Thermotomaculum hydrothermale]|uniref:Uncharacterized protein n=1 Tax=Thermotomaculum hydrothermale TaxID=981385 RepID=A0A7R6SYX7_9BACT|nr:hypothetical protein [Thermotomaculum hydrothermale]BBB33254.1 hypothetical protein TTHT_1792 [Thermotomaculum hydrothermale]